MIKSNTLVKLRRPLSILTPIGSQFTADYIPPPPYRNLPQQWVDHRSTIGLGAAILHYVINIVLPTTYCTDAGRSSYLGDASCLELPSCQILPSYMTLMR
ncbi:hypothetical protein J6590_049553 [Homalodisca vitripennis]|nr:hypothetical protein J6590_049553 [Homalodisca vitripennis]